LNEVSKIGDILTRCAEYHYDPKENQMTALGTQDSRVMEARDRNYKKVSESYPDYFGDSFFRQSFQSKESAEQIRLRQESRTKKDSNAFFDFHKTIYNKHGLREDSEIDTASHYQTYLTTASTSGVISDLEIPYAAGASE